MEFYSATKKNEILSFTSKWMELENIILSEVRNLKLVIASMGRVQRKYEEDW
jgi:hypothetical protein